MAFHVRSQRHESALKSQTNSQRSRRRIGRRPVFELLEERRLLAPVTWDGEAGDNLWNSAANWSGDTIPTTNDDVVITESAPSLILLQGSSVSVNTLVASTSVSISTPLIVANGAQLSGIATLGPFTVTLGGQNSLGGLVVEHGGIVTAFAGQALQVTVQGDVCVASTGSISADARGFGAGQGPGAGVGSGNVGSTGGGYGGRGGSNGGVAGGSPYGSVDSPTDLGSSSGNPYPGSFPGYGVAGAGGGAIKLEVDGELSLDGRIAADGGSGTLYSGGGSGGSVWLIAASLVGSGTISANGGNSGSQNEGGGGGGGRVAIHTQTNTLTGSVTAQGGTGYASQNGGAGTSTSTPHLGPNLLSTTAASPPPAQRRCLRLFLQL